MTDDNLIVFNLGPEFQVEAIVGQGAYGYVCKAQWQGVCVAIKKIPGYARNVETAKKVLREMEILLGFQYCQQVVECHTIFRDEKNKDIYLVMNYIPSDLSATLKKGVSLTEDIIRYIVCQLLLAMRAMHHHGVIHRDLSCRNILVDENSCISVCDFGLSRVYDPEEQLSFGVVTQWYRAPEIITDAAYDTKSDIFSIGVIMGELMLRKHFFPGRPNDAADQLCYIFAILGTPSFDLFEDPSNPYSKASENAKNFVRTFTKKKPSVSQLRSLNYKISSPQSLDLLEKLLSFDPLKRPSAREALQSSWFDPLRDYINQEEEAQDQSHRENPVLDLTDIPNNITLERVLAIIEGRVPTFSSEISEKWRRDNAEAAEEGNES